MQGNQKLRDSVTGEKLAVSQDCREGGSLYNVILQSADAVVYLTRKTRGGFRKYLISIGAFSDSEASVYHKANTRTNKEDRRRI